MLYFDIERERAKSCRTIVIFFYIKVFAPDLKWIKKIDIQRLPFEYGGLHCDIYI